MNVGILAYGSRGDVQPIIALGLGLQRSGHAVTICAGSNFEKWIRGYGLGFASFGVDIQALMQSPEGIAWVEGPGWQQPLHMRRLFKKVGDVAPDAVLALADACDVLISSFTSDGLALSAAEALGKRWVSIGLQPLRPTRAGYATYMAPRPRVHSMLNARWGVASELALWSIFAEAHNALRRRLGLKTHSFADYRRETYRVPLIYGFSEHVMPRPDDYAPHWHVAGYWFVDEPDWQPPAALRDFLSAGEPPVYIGFGSATDRDAQATTQLILRALQETGQRALIYGGWAGLGEPGQTRGDRVMFVGGMPHSWLFARVSAVVHHGGGGTTGAGARAGVPSMLIPHFAEQPLWARRLFELGVSPPPVDKRQLSASALASGLRRMRDDTAMRERAAALGAAIQREDGVTNAVQLIEACLPNL
jgi:UDP:flavonoid glycosyltransferase YjiC (YdhE family)